MGKNNVTTNFLMLVLKWLKINCLMLYSRKNKYLVLSKYPHSDPLTGLRSHLLIIHTLLFSRQYKVCLLLCRQINSIETSHVYARIEYTQTVSVGQRIFPKVSRNGKKMGNGVMGRSKWTIPFNKGPLKINGAGINSSSSRSGSLFKLG